MKNEIITDYSKLNTEKYDIYAVTNEDRFLNSTINAKAQDILGLLSVLCGFQDNEDNYFSFFRDMVVILCYACQYITLEELSLFFSFPFDKSAAREYMKKLLTDGLIKKERFYNQDSRSKYAYCLSKRGIDYASTLVPSSCMNEVKIRRSSGIVPVHDYSAGINIFTMIASLLPFSWKKEVVYNGVYRAKKALRTDFVFPILNADHNTLYIEEDLGTERTHILLEKIARYHDHEIAYHPTNVLVFSMRDSISNPYMNTIFSKTLNSISADVMEELGFDSLTLFYLQYHREYSDYKNNGTINSVGIISALERYNFAYIPKAKAETAYKDQLSIELDNYSIYLKQLLLLFGSATLSSRDYYTLSASDFIKHCHFDSSASVYRFDDSGIKELTNIRECNNHLSSSILLTHDPLIIDRVNLDTNIFFTGFDTSLEEFHSFITSCMNGSSIHLARYNNAKQGYYTFGKELSFLSLILNRFERNLQYHDDIATLIGGFKTFLVPTDCLSPHLKDMLPVYYNSMSDNLELLYHYYAPAALFCDTLSLAANSPVTVVLRNAFFVPDYHYLEGSKYESVCNNIMDLIETPAAQRVDRTSGKVALPTLSYRRVVGEGVEAEVKQMLRPILSLSDYDYIYMLSYGLCTPAAASAPKALALDSSRIVRRKRKRVTETVGATSPSGNRLSISFGEENEENTKSGSRSSSSSSSSSQYPTSLTTFEKNKRKNTGDALLLENDVRTSACANKDCTIRPISKDTLSSLSEHAFGSRYLAFEEGLRFASTDKGMADFLTELCFDGELLSERKAAGAFDYTDCIRKAGGLVCFESGYDISALTRAYYIEHYIDLSALPYSFIHFVFKVESKQQAVSLAKLCGWTNEYNSYVSYKPFNVSFKIDGKDTLYRVSKYESKGENENYEIFPLYPAEDESRYEIDDLSSLL